MGHKKDPTYFCLYFCRKSTDFNADFTVRFKDEWHICWYELDPTHLISVATLSVNVKTPKNVILAYSRRLPKKIISNVS